ncbi:hypothetical protein ACHAW5_007701 [Stephanodiscus triporus]|uniref:Uncharacterized protein n=1 Tax=Stephanodiscus triporus TaxID=2934178 RepID=A0ABD3MGZ0_9STRA
MKVSPLLFYLSASFIAEKVSARVRAKLIERFKIVGSDGVCENYLDLPTGCSKNFNIVADKFDDGTDEGTVKGVFQNVVGTNGRGQHGYVDCLNIFEQDGDTYGIVRLVFTEGNDVVPIVPGDKFFYAGMINGTTGTGYRSNPWYRNETTTCFDDVWVDFFVDDSEGKMPFFENNGKVTIEVLK